MKSLCEFICIIQNLFQGTLEDLEEAKSFSKLEGFTQCDDLDVCVQVTTEFMQLHNQEADKEYRFTLKAYNGAGSSTLWYSPYFEVSQTKKNHFS